MFLPLRSIPSPGQGSLEARIEALEGEGVSLRKQLERENDALKIKTKVIDDQTDTIKKLKDVSMKVLFARKHEPNRMKKRKRNIVI